MCFISENKEPKIAKKSFTVHKIFRKKNSKLISPFIDFQYKVDTLYETKIKEDKSTVFKSAFDNLSVDYLNKHFSCWNSNNPRLIYIEEGFHSILPGRKLPNNQGDHMLYK